MSAAEPSAVEGLDAGALYLVGGGAQRGQHQHRQCKAFRTHPAHKMQPVRAGQHPVQDHRVEGVCVEAVYPFGGGGGGGHGDAVRPQQLFQKPAQRAVVLDQQQFHANTSCLFVGMISYRIPQKDLFSV